MKLASTIVSWVGWLAQAILYFVFLARGADVVVNGEVKHGQYAGWMWAIAVFMVIIGFGVLIWRQWAINNGKKVVPGVLTTIFASVAGGVMTFFIPEYDLF